MPTLQVSPSISIPVFRQKPLSEVMRELNLLMLGGIRQIADMPDGAHHLKIQFGIDSKTTEAVRELRMGDISKIADNLGDTFLFAAKRPNGTLYQLVRSGLPENDVFVLSRLSSVIAEKQA